MGTHPNFSAQRDRKLSQKNGMCPSFPRHVAIIMDGNGRWAKRKHLPRIAGHRKGAQAVQKIVKASSDAGIKVLTLYVFSTENWKRPVSEVRFLMKLLARYIEKEIAALHQENVRINAVGRLKELPDSIQNLLAKAIERTKHNKGLILNLAINYGGRQEIIDGIRKIAADLKKSSLKIEDLNEENFSRYLYTEDLPEPDLIIRTSGEKRLSNFLLWQSSYAELYVTETLWPDFGREDLLLALEDYSKRKRKFGGTSK